MVVIDNLAPGKNNRIKGTSQDWIDAEIKERINKWDKLFKKFKTPHLHVNKHKYKEERNQVQKLIHTINL